VGLACQADSDCNEFYEFCTDNNVCKHRLIFPARGIEIAAYFVFALLVTTSNFGGIAGGFGFISLMSMFGFDLKTSIILSNAQIVISSIIRISTGLGKPHPERKTHGTLFHFNVISMIIPAAALASALATVINRVIPDLVIVILYAVVLTGVFVYNIMRFITVVKKET